MDAIVVGIDGSPHARAALAWATGYARRTGARLRAVAVCPYPDVVGLPGLWVPVETTENARKRVTEMLDRVTAEVVGEQPDVPLEREVIMGSPAPALLDAAASADLLVVGTRGADGFHGLMLGSVSHQCVSHAPARWWSSPVRPADGQWSSEPGRLDVWSLVTPLPGGASTGSFGIEATDERRLACCRPRVPRPM